DHGDWTALSSAAFGESGAASVTPRVRPLQEAAQIQVRTGSETGPLRGTSDVAGRVGEWSAVSAALSGATGTRGVFCTYPGPEGGLMELDSWECTEATGEPTLDVTVTADTRCVVGRAVLTVRANNGEDRPVTVEADTAYGSTVFTDLGPERGASHAFTTRQASLPAGDVDVTLRSEEH